MACGENRQRLRPWLESKISSGTIPGLAWIDEEKTTFKMPWKHAGKQNWRENDCLLFKEWAIHTGRFREGMDDPDYATWKTRLRCAFNKAPDIQELKNLSRLDDPNDPFRIYKLLPKPDKKTHQDIVNHNKPATPVYEESDMECESVHQGPAQVPTSVTQKFHDSLHSTSGSLPSDLKNIHSLDLLSSAAQAMSANPSDWMGSYPDIQPKDEDTSFHFMDMDNGAIVGNNGNPVMVGVNDYPTNEGSVAPIAELMSCIGSDDPLSFDEESFLRMTGQAGFSSNHRIGVKICYREHIAYEYVPNNESGCRIFYGTPYPNTSMGLDVAMLFGPSNLEQIEFPPCDGLCQTLWQQHHTKRLLGCLNRGLILELDKSGSIYATRLCRCVVYVAMPFSEGNPVKLERQKKVKVFDYETDFMPMYHKYAAGKGHKPSIQVHFGFGQTWSCTQPIKNLMIKAVIVNTKALELMYQIQNSDTTVSTHSVEVSEKDDYDKLADCIKQQTLNDCGHSYYNQQ